jgi:hypothetical protein
MLRDVEYTSAAANRAISGAIEWRKENIPKIVESSPYRQHPTRDGRSFETLKETPPEVGSGQQHRLPGRDMPGCSKQSSSDSKRFGSMMRLTRVEVMKL